MKKKLNAYEWTYACLTTWVEVGMEKHPILTAIVLAPIFNWLFL